MFFNLKRVLGVVASITLIGVALSAKEASAITRWNKNRFSSVELPASMENKIIGNGVMDPHHYIKGFNKYVPNYSTHAKFITKNSGKIFGAEVINTFNASIPKAYGQRVSLDLMAFVEYSKNKFGFEFVNYTYNSNNKKDVSLRKIKSISLARTNFEIKTSLANRLTVMTDSENGIKMVFPNGVGSFDEGTLNPGLPYSVLTPRFKNGYLVRNGDYAIKKRTKPSYFAGMPFIRIANGKQIEGGVDRTAIGFHIQPNKAKFVRAFDSHGCIRMREADLFTLYNIIAHGPNKFTPIVVDNFIDSDEEHAFPKQDKPYKRVYDMNRGNSKAPYWKTDLFNMAQVYTSTRKENGKEVNNSAPVHMLENVEDDNWNDLYDYNMQKRIEKRCKDIHLSRAKNLKSLSLSTYMSDSDREKLDKEISKAHDKGTKGYYKCVKNGAKKVSARSRFRRWRTRRGW